jgi:hypothetical protein
MLHDELVVRYNPISICGLSLLDLLVKITDTEVRLVGIPIWRLNR